MLIEEKILDNIGKIGQINIEKAKNMGRKFFIGRICITDGIRRMGYSEESPELNELFEKFIKIFRKRCVDFDIFPCGRMSDSKNFCM